MAMTWEERLTKVVLPAIKEGIHIYTGFGELHPGNGIPQTTAKEPEAAGALPAKPAGLPIWQVYLPAKATQPALRFLQFIHKVRNPVGPATMVYPTRLRDGNLGVPLIVPLGEGFDTPARELNIARDLQAMILYKPVKIIAIGRCRFFTTTSPWSLVEPVIMEVYSERGDLLWTNPFIEMTLEQVVAQVAAAEVLRTIGAATAPMAAQPPPVVPFPVPSQGPAEPTTQVVSDKRRVVEGLIRHLFGQGLDDGAVKAQVARTHGVDIKVATRLVDDFRKRNEPSMEIRRIVLDFAGQFAGFYEGDELVEAVADASGKPLDLVHGILAVPPFQATKEQPAPLAAKPVPPAPAEKKPQVPASHGALLESMGLGDQRDFSMSVEGVTNNPQELADIQVPTGAMPRSVAKRSRRVPSEGGNDVVSHIIKDVHLHMDDYKQRVITYLGSTERAQAGEIRGAIGIPPGSTEADGMKRVSDLFRKSLLECLEEEGFIIREGSGRSTYYRLPRY